ncbi:MAG: DUF3341 domain-containing protein [Chthoniobacterales bacterium]
MKEEVHGMMAEFGQADQLLAAIRRAYKAGYRKMDAYSPYAVEGAAEALGFTRTRIPLIVLIGGITGAFTAYGMQWYSAVIDYPLNVGGRPLHSWPAFVPITFELTVLFAAIAGLLGMLWLNGLPKPYHPVFNAPQFKLASQTRFFLCIEARDPLFRATEVRQLLQSLNPISVTEVAK